MKKLIVLVSTLLNFLPNIRCFAKEPELLPPMVMTWNIREQTPRVYTIEKDFYYKARVITGTIACVAIVLCTLLEWYAMYRAFKNGENKKNKNENNDVSELYWLLSSTPLTPF